MGLGSIICKEWRVTWTSPIRQLLYSMFNLFDLLAPKDIHVV